MAEFNQALQRTLKYEGDKLFVDPQTNERSRYGITQKTLTAIKYITTDPNNLTMLEVEDVYLRLYWNLNKLSELTSQLVANKIFDMAVNMGSFQAIKLVQASINSIGGACVIDGLMGPHTLLELDDAVRYKGESAFLEELRLKCVSFYKSIGVGQDAKYLAGWLTRANDIGLGERDESAFNTLRDGNSDKVVKG